MRSITSLTLALPYNMWEDLGTTLVEMVASPDITLLPDGREEVNWNLRLIPLTDLSSIRPA